MKLNDIFKRAARLAGTGEEFLGENETEKFRARALDAINSVLFDLCEKEPYEGLMCDADITDKAADAAVYGTAMFLSLAYGDTDKSTLFSSIYNGKRAAVKSSIGEISDVLPRTGAV